MFSARSSIPDEIALESLPEAPDEGGTLIINSVSEEATLVHRARRSLGTVLGLRVDRQVWGLAPLDLGILVRCGAKYTREQPRLPADEEERLSVRRSGRIRQWSRSLIEMHEMEEHASHELGGMPWYKLPQPLHSWGNPQYALHPSWGDLFLDLIYVATAYQMSYLLGTSFYHCVDPAEGDGSHGSEDEGEGVSSGDHRLLSAPRRTLAETPETLPICHGLGLGVLFAVSLFHAIQRLWLTETTYYRALFSAFDKAHICLDMICYFCLMASSSNIGSINYYIHPTDGGDVRIFGFLLPLWFAAFLWWVRMLEIALCAPSAASRRWAGARVIDDLGMLLLWTIPLFLDLLERGMMWKERGVLFILLGAHWPEIRLFWRLAIVPRLPGEHLTTESSRPPANLTFLIHRFDEFMYLMLGETVLGIVLAPRLAGTHAQHHYTTMAAGFLVVTCMLFSYQVIEPRDAKEHAFRRSAAAGVLYVFFFALKTVAVLMVGVGIKLTLYDPTASSTAYSTTTLRLQLGVSVAVCFALELIMRPLHVGVKRYYSLRTLLQRSRKRTVVIALRLLLIVAMAAVSKLRLSPVDFLWTEAGLVVTSTILAHLQHFKLSLSDIEEYVHRKREKASELPKFKSKRREGGLG